MLNIRATQINLLQAPAQELCCYCANTPTLQLCQPQVEHFYLKLRINKDARMKIKAQDLSNVSRPTEYKEYSSKRDPQAHPMHTGLFCIIIFNRLVYKTSENCEKCSQHSFLKVR